jgi:hypothetical protein
MEKNLSLGKFSFVMGDRFGPQGKAELPACVKSIGRKNLYHVDADHLRLETVDCFNATPDFFAIDVADSIAKPVATPDAKAFGEANFITEVSMDETDSSQASPETGGEGLEIAKDIYVYAIECFDEFCTPYASDFHLWLSFFTIVKCFIKNV